MPLNTCPLNACHASQLNFLFLPNFLMMLDADRKIYLGLHERKDRDTGHPTKIIILYFYLLEVHKCIAIAHRAVVAFVKEFQWD